MKIKFLEEAFHGTMYTLDPWWLKFPISIRHAWCVPFYIKEEDSCHVSVVNVIVAWKVKLSGGLVSLSDFKQNMTFLFEFKSRFNLPPILIFYSALCYLDFARSWWDDEWMKKTVELYVEQSKSGVVCIVTSIHLDLDCICTTKTFRKM